MTDVSEGDEATGPVVRDKRRIDPVTGQLRMPGTTPAAAAASGPTEGNVSTDPSTTVGEHSVVDPLGAASASAPPPHEVPADGAAGPLPGDSLPDGGAAQDDYAAQLAERTSDLQRLQAEFTNYRRRVERDREAVKDQAVGSVLSALLPVLDDLDRAREHGQLEGGFKAVAEALEVAVGKLGLVRFGEAGEPFDPVVHEALLSEPSEDVTEPTAARILQPGYRIGERILRPARVAVAEPAA